MLYFDCGSGISGDMAVAAMLDLGADAQGLLDVLESLDLDFHVAISDVTKSGIRAKDFSVGTGNDDDRNPEYLYGNAEGHGGEEERGFDDIATIIDNSALSVGAKSTAMRILSILSDAESAVHGIPRDRVHFHEVGAVDSIIDIVSLAYCVESLKIDEIAFSDLCEGTGTVRCRHGVLPVPVPAVTEIAKTHGIPMCITSSPGEYVTPTGAAFVAAVRNSDLPRSFVVHRIGIGAGKRQTEKSGLLRAMILHPTAEADAVKIECNTDDCTGEELGHAMEKLFAVGAKDVCYAPVFMKKNRPGWLLTVICSEEDREAVECTIFRETSTVGIRRIPVERTVMDRRIVTVTTELGDARVKISEYGGIVKVHPEYDDVASLAEKSGKPFREVYDSVLSAYGKRLISESDYRA